MFKKRYMVFVFLIIIVLSRFIPAKVAVSSENLEEYAVEGSVVLLCKGVQITGPYWTILDYYGVEDAPQFIDIIGEEPSEVLVKDIYNYQSKFIFVGNFSKDNPEIFESIRWEIVADIERFSKIIPLPKKYLNIWEVEWWKRKDTTS